MRVSEFVGFRFGGFGDGSAKEGSAPDSTIARGDVGPLELNESAGVDSVGQTKFNAGSLAIGSSTNGYINTVGDRDWYAVTMVAGQSYTFSLVGGTLTDTYLEIYSSSGALIGLDDDFGTGSNATLRWTATTTDTYYISAEAFEDGLSGSYTLSAATSAPAGPLDAIDYHFTMPTTNISIWFASSGYTNPSNDTAVRAWTQGEIDAVISALGGYAAIAPLTFSVAASQGAATWIFSLAELTGNTLGYFAVGDNYAAFDPTVSNFTAGLVPGGNSWVTIIHEAGHGLGMAHPHDNGAENYGPDNSEVMQGVTDAFSSYGTFFLNQGVFTTMSYNDGWTLSGFGATPSNLTGGQATPMALDVALIQQRYGINPNTGAGDSVYTLALASSAYVCIWDVSGTDGITYSGSAPATIDLRAATLLNAIGGGGYVSFVQGVHGGFTIANGVVIENASGGTGGDTLIGNDANNVLTGGLGSDSVNGNGGNDTIFGGVGSDLLDGGDGDDTLDGGSDPDTINGNDGNDTIFWDSADGTSGATGGAGSDILVFTSGSAPTAFNLVAQGFEGAQGRFTVTGATYTDYYDAQWRLSEERGQANNGTSWFFDWDETNSAPYQRLDQDFDTSAQLAHEHGLADNGSTWDQYFDTDGSHPYVYILQVHTANGTYANEHGISDNGSTWDTFFDVDGSNPFQWIQQVRDANGVLAQEEGLADSGTRWFTDYDETGTTDYVFYQNVYDTLNRLSFQNGQYDTGYTWTIDYDETNTQPWTSIRNDYDDHGVLIGTTTILDGP